MSYEGDFYGQGGNVYGQDQSVNYEFGQFDYSGHDQTNNTSYGHNQTSFAPQSQPSLYNPVTGAMNTDPFYPSDPSGGDDPFADELPLLEELGINFDQITEKTLAVINPLKSTQADILRDSDLAGPLVFCLAFGCFLLLSGKVSFGYIYGIGVCGCLSMYALLNLMSSSEVPISVANTVSVLGYCLLPMVLLSGLSVIINLNNGLVGTVFSVLTVSWCAWSASKLFVTALSLHNQQALVLYPCALLYGVFALLTVF